MNSLSRTTVAVIAAVAALSMTVPSSAQQKAAPSAPAAQQGPAVVPVPALPVPTTAPAPVVQAPAPSAAVAPVTASPAAEPTAPEGKLTKLGKAAMSELSPWLMF